MYRFVVFAIGLAAVGAHPKPGEMPACGRVSHGGLQCCKKEMPPVRPPPNEFKECFQLMKKPPSCDVEICIAKKRGVASDDGTIDKKKMAEEIEQKFENDPDLVDALKDNCINGDFSNYGPDDFCDLMKQRMCFEVQMIKSCTEWKEDGDCSGMKELAAECVKQFS